MPSRSLSVRTIVESKTYKQTKSTIFPDKRSFVGKIIVLSNYLFLVLLWKIVLFAVRFRFSDRTHILWVIVYDPAGLSIWPQNDLSNLFQCIFLCRLLLWPNSFSLDILLFRHILFLEQEQTEIFFFVGYPEYQIELILEHAGPTKGV